VDRDVDPFLRWLAVDPVLAAAASPLDLVVGELARTVGADWAFAGEIRHRAPATVRTVAWWRDGRLHEPVEYPVAGTPCEPVCQGLPRCHPRGVVRTFPGASVQRAEDLVAYAAHPLTVDSGRPLGLVAVMSRRPFEAPDRIARVLATCAPRVAGELWKLKRRDASGGRDDRGTAQQRDRLLREVHQHTRSHLQIVTSLLVMQGGTSADPRLRQTLAEAASRISAIALVHAQLAETPGRIDVDMKRFVEQVADNLQRTFDPSQNRVTIRMALDELHLPLRLAVPCGLLVAELVTNAFRHAYAHTHRGAIEVRVAATDTEVTVVVRDDGRALTPEGRDGLGLRLVRMLATRQLQGEISVDRPDGTAFTVRFPWSAASAESWSHPPPS
jgi:two-component sensor histidine kinase